MVIYKCFKCTKYVYRNGIWLVRIVMVADWLQQLAGHFPYKMILHGLSKGSQLLRGFEHFRKRIPMLTCAYFANGWQQTANYIFSWEKSFYDISKEQPLVFTNGVWAHLVVKHWQRMERHMVRSKKFTSNLGILILLRAIFINNSEVV